MDEASQSPQARPASEQAAPEQTNPEQTDKPGFIDLSVTREGEPDGLRDRVLDQIRTVFDPEIPVNIYELGLIYDLKIDGEGSVEIVMTLTSPMCPVAESLPVDVENRVKGAEGVNAAKVEITWEPTWTMEKMSEVARLELGM